MLKEKRFVLIAVAATGLFLIFTVFTAPLFSMVAFTPARGGGYMQQASAQAQSTPPPPAPPPTLPFTPFSLQQQQEQEAVPPEDRERKAGEKQQELGGAIVTEEPPTVGDETSSPSPPAATDNNDDQTTTLRPTEDPSLTPLPTEPTRQGEDQSAAGGGSNATAVPSRDRQLETIVHERVWWYENCHTIGRVVGGGFNSALSTAEYHASSPAGGRLWELEEWRPFNYWSTWGEDVFLDQERSKVYAVCAIIKTSENAVNSTTTPSSGSEYPHGSVGVNIVNIEPNGVNSVVASCPEGEEITGGGFLSFALTKEWDSLLGGLKTIAKPKDTYVSVYKSYPSGNGWAVEAKSKHESLPTRLIVYAECLSRMLSENAVNSTTTPSSGSEEIESNPRNVPLTIFANGVNSAVSSCQEGEAITGGGWYSQSSDVSVYKSYPSGNGWLVEAKNRNPTDGRSLVVYAVCARIVSIAQQVIPATVPSLPTNDTGTTMTPATNDTGVAAVTELPSSSSEPPLMVEAIANTTQAVAPATIRLDANITGGAPPYSYTWSDPNLGLIDQDRSITLNFFEPGTFTYTLTVTDSRGKVVTDNVQIVISERGLPQGGIVAPEPGGIAPPQEEGGLLPSTPPPPPPNDNEVISPPPEGGGEEPPTTEEGGEEPPPPPPPDDSGGEETPPDEEPTTPPDGE